MCHRTACRRAQGLGEGWTCWTAATIHSLGEGSNKNDQRSGSMGQQEVDRGPDIVHDPNHEDQDTVQND